MKRRILTLLFFAITATICAQHPNDVMYALTRAKENRKGLEELLNYYKKNDKEKYQAACFLIANMPWHKQYYHIKNIDKRLNEKLETADSLYYELVKNHNDNELFNNDFYENILAKKDQAFRKEIESIIFEQPNIDRTELLDIEFIDKEFLKRQIEHSFNLRRELKNIQKLKDEEFYEYILSYRALNSTPAISANVYNKRYAKYLHNDTCSNVENLVRRYNITLRRLRNWGGIYPFRIPIGEYELFFNGFHDCVLIADYGALILRACGQPAAVEYNIAYKFWNGNHYHVSIPTKRGWETFSPESGLPMYKDYRFYETLNIYRINYSRQLDNPYSLKNTNEPIPDNLSDARIKDVTKEICSTVELSLSFKEQTNHKLAYLGSFVSQDLGLRPVTWGLINHKNNTVDFKNVVPDNLYFPIYMDEFGDYHSFGNPFVLSLKNGTTYIQEINPGSNKKVTAKIERKYPRKPHLLKQAEKVIGTFIIASNIEDFSVADTIGYIRDTPQTFWEYIELDIKQPYQYYRVCSAEKPAKLRLGELRFLTKKKYNYENTEVLSRENSSSITYDSTWLWILDEPFKKCSWKAEYDNDPKTAPDKWPDVTLKLKYPQYVHRICYVAKHADNTVNDRDRYDLYTWSDGFWKRTHKNLETIGRYIIVNELIPNQLYWLHKKGEGKEELPFYLDDNGIQHFPHLQFLKKNEQIKEFQIVK